MKKILISVFAMALAAPAFAQPEQGQITVGGALGLSNVVDDGDRSTMVSFTPELGYMVSDNLEIGLLLDYSFAKNAAVYDINGSGIYSNLNMYGVGVFARNYVSISDKVSFAVAGGAQYMFGDEGENSPKVKLSGFGIRVQPEFWFNVTPTTSLVAALGGLQFTSLKGKYESTELGTTNSFDLNWGQVSLGVKFAF